MNIQGWFPLGVTGLISLLSKGLSSATIQKHEFFGAEPSLWTSSHICTWFHWKWKSERISCSVISNSLGPYGLLLTKLLCSWNSPGKNTVVASHSLLQGIFPTQGLNLGFLADSLLSEAPGKPHMTLFSPKKEWSTDTWCPVMSLDNIKLSERNQTPKTEYCMMPYSGNVLVRQIQRDKLDRLILTLWQRGEWRIYWWIQHFFLGWWKISGIIYRCYFLRMY